MSTAAWLTNKTGSSLWFPGDCFSLVLVRDFMDQKIAENQTGGASGDVRVFFQGSLAARPKRVSPHAKPLQESRRRSKSAILSNLLGGAFEGFVDRSLIGLGLLGGEAAKLGEETRGAGCEMLPETAPMPTFSHDPSTTRPALAFASVRKGRPLRSG
jgi:hypothetical protein